MTSLIDVQSQRKNKLNKQITRIENVKQSNKKLKQMREHK